MTTLPDIALLVPHAKPMLLLDRVVSADEESLQAEVMIHADSLFYTEAGVGAWVGIEYMAQAIAAYAGYRAHLSGEPVKIGFLLGTRHYKCQCAFFPSGSLLKIHVRCLLQADNGLGSFECSITDVQQILLATATLTVFQPKDVTKFLSN